MNSKLFKIVLSILLTSTLLFGSITAPGSISSTYAVEAAQASSIYIAPTNNAKFLVGAKFDFRVELNDLSTMPRVVNITINGLSAEKFFNQAFTKTNTTVTSEEYTLRDVTFTIPGQYAVKVQADHMQQTVNYEVVVADMYGKKAKNVIFFNGDGMGHPVVTAARIMSKGMTEGKYDGLLEMDTMDTRAVVATSGLDSIATDSANSASAYATGHKAEVNALGVYPDNTEDTLDNPKVETIIEMVIRSRGMSTGIVSTAEIEDASPAAGVSHTRRRADKSEIAEMFYNVKPDVILGGGSAYFLPQSVAGSKRNDDKDLFTMFENDGYEVTVNRSELLNVSSETDKLLGLFHLGNMNTYYDRSTKNKEVIKEFNDQPTLWEMTETAIDVLNKNENGFFLMVEAGSVDKQLHPLDWERAVLDTIEMDKAIGIAKRFAEKHGDTLIVVTADHAHSMSITGTYWEGDGKSGKDAVRTYASSGFPTYVDADGDGFPDEMDTEKKLAVHFANHPDYYEDYKMDPVPTSPALQNEDGIYVANPGKLLNPTDENKEKFLQVGPLNSSTGVHTIEDVPLMAHGTGSQYFNGFLDNTDVFYAIANAMGLQLTGEKKADNGLVELRQFIESLDGTILYNEKSDEVTIKLNDTTAEINLGTGNAVVNRVSMKTEIMTINQRAYVTKEFAIELLKLN